MGKRIAYVDFEVHKNFITVAFADGVAVVVRPYGAINPDLASLDKVAGKLVSRGREPRFAYEAGPHVYGIYRHMRPQNFKCVGAAPSLIHETTYTT